MLTDTVVHTPLGRAFRSFLNPVAMSRNLWSHRSLMWQLAKRDLLVRYRQTKLGLLWSVLTPLLMLAVYTFAFAVVLGARWSRDSQESKAQFALIMFCGLLLYNLFAEVVVRAPGMVVGCPQYVKRVVFPLEVLVPAGLITALINMLIGYVAWLVGWFLLNHTLPHPSAAWFPLVLLPVCLITVGLGWLLASLGVFLRDVGHAVQVLLQIMFFATPIFYSIESVKPPYRLALQVNPLSHAVEDARQVLMWGGTPNWYWWAFTMIAGGLLAVLGYAFFMKSKRAFADVI
jgi:lipopolysaccharide transport system permease protein